MRIFGSQIIKKDNKLENCEIQDQVDYELCIRCKEGYIYNKIEKICEKIENLIANCLIYNSLDRTCYQCSKGYTLSDDKSNCFDDKKNVNLVNTDNSNFFEKDENSFKELNYYSNNNITYDENCEDSISFTGANICHICDTGYYVNDRRKCEKEHNNNSLCMIEHPEVYFYFEMNGYSEPENYSFYFGNSNNNIIF